MRSADRPPCIVCGRRRHDPAAHDAYRREYRRCKNLLRKTWPRLATAAVLAWYAKREPARPPSTERRPIGWTCKVLRSGQVLHVPVWPEEPAGE